MIDLDFEFFRKNVFQVIKIMKFAVENRIIGWFTFGFIFSYFTKFLKFRCKKSWNNLKQISALFWHFK